MQRKKGKHKVAGVLFCLLFSSCLWATPSRGSFPDKFFNQNLHPVLTFTTGAAFNASAGQSANFPATPTLFSFYNYAATHVHQTQLLLGGFVGAEYVWHPQWSVQAGIGYYQPGTFNVQGYVTQGVDVPTQNQYAYTSAIESHQFLIESKLLYRYKRYQPYLAAGLGASLNNSQNYLVNIQPPNTTFSNQFQAKTTTSFSYSVGFGVEMPVAKRMRIGLGYRFTDFGAVKTGTGMIGNAATNYTISQPHLYANEVLAQFTAILDDSKPLEHRH